MGQEDYFKRQIDQLGRVLGKILATFLGLKNQGDVLEAIESSQQTMMEELGINLDEIINTPEDLILDFLEKNKISIESNFEVFAEIIYQIADVLKNEGQDEKATKLFERVLIIYEHLEETSKNYSIDRKIKIEKIKQLGN